MKELFGQVLDFIIPFIIPVVLIYSWLINNKSRGGGEEPSRKSNKNTVKDNKSEHRTKLNNGSSGNSSDTNKDSKRDRSNETVDTVAVSQPDLEREISSNAEEASRNQTEDPFNGAL